MQAAYEFVSRFRSLPGEIANIAAHLPSAAVQHLQSKYGLQTVERYETETNPLVVLIHGTNGGSWQWAVTRPWLASAGFESSCLTYASENRIAQSAALLLKALKELLTGTERPFVLVGHSQGGLLARMLYERCKSMEGMNCSKVFILHAPQKGTKAAKMWNGLLTSIGFAVADSMRDMEDGAEFVQFYEEYCVDPDDPNVFETAGSSDYVQEEEAMFSCLPENRYVGAYGHYSAMVNKALWTEFIIPNLALALRPIQESGKAI